MTGKHATAGGRSRKRRRFRPGYGPWSQPGPSPNAKAGAPGGFDPGAFYETMMRGAMSGTEPSLDVPSTPPNPDTRDRHLYRVLQQILMEVRACRQYTQFLHLLLANAEIGKEAGLTTPADSQKRMSEHLQQQQKKEEERQRIWLAKRASRGIGNGGMDLTEDEARAIGRGEYIGDEDEEE